MTRFALFQHALAPPDPEAVGRALDAVPWLARADAHLLLRRAHGVLVDGLDEDGARALAAALAEAGVGVEVVAQDWLRLPPAQSCRRADPRPEGLVLHDLYGRTQLLPWSGVLALAAGRYTTTQRVPRQSTGNQNHSSWRGARTAWARGEGLLGSRQEVDYVEREQIILDLVVDLPARYRIQLEQFDYRCLGPERTHSASLNFARLARLLVAHAPDALKNQGLHEFGPDARELYHYPGLRAFERELAWRLWRELGPGASIDAGAGPYRTGANPAQRLSAPLARDVDLPPRALRATATADVSAGRVGIEHDKLADLSVSVAAATLVFVVGAAAGSAAALLALPLAPAVYLGLRWRRSRR